MISEIELSDYVKQGLSIRNISLKAGISSGSVRNALKKYGLKTEHTKYVGNRSWNDEQLVEAVRTSTTIVDIIRKLGLSDTSAGNWKTIKNHIERLKLDTSHHIGKQWVKNSQIHPHKYSTEEILVENSTYASSNRLFKRLVKEGLKEAKCESCGNTHWLDLPLKFELDHKNGDNRDNRIENLRVLCPNCHSQTSTWRKKKSLR